MPTLNPLEAGPGRSIFSVLYDSENRVVKTQIIKDKLARNENLDLIQDIHIDDIIASLRRIENELLIAIEKKTTKHATSGNPNELAASSINTYPAHRGRGIKVFPSWLPGRAQTLQEWLDEFFLRVSTFNGQVASIIVEPSSASIVRGQTISVNARAYDLQGAQILNAPFVWESADPTIVSVSGVGGTGTVVGNTEGGPIEVRVKVRSQIGTCAVTVISGGSGEPPIGDEPPPEPPSISVDFYGVFDLIPHIGLSDCVEPDTEDMTLGETLEALDDALFFCGAQQNNDKLQRELGNIMIDLANIINLTIGLAFSFIITGFLIFGLASYDRWRAHYLIVNSTKLLMP